ncbi:hypothetical protein P8452_44922 [Trifolium repens]|nr:hypothetical protein P8452_44922 [Trifolium repens]
MTQLAPITLPTIQFGGDHDYRRRRGGLPLSFYVALGVLLTVGALILIFLMYRRIAKARRRASIAPGADNWWVQ